MRIRISAGGPPAHAPSWVRSNHWPAAAAVAGVAALGIVLASVHDTSVRPSTAPNQHAVAAGQALGGVPVQPAPALIVAPSGTVVVAPSPTPSPTPPPTPADPATISTLASDGIPVTALDAYKKAAEHMAVTDPGCHLPWPLLAAIGRVESDHGRFGGAVLYADGTSSHRILGIPLDGRGTALITDTDHGRLDGDTVFDRAVGPMQFIPSTWAAYGVDGNHDGTIDPFNIYDAAAAAARYLCTAGGDLSTLKGQVRAVLAYNHSTSYLNTVLQLERTYAKGVAGLVVPVGPAPVTRPRVLHHKVPPPVDPGRPLAAPHPHRPSPSPTTSPPDTTLPTWVSPSPSASDTSASPDPTPTDPSTCPTPTDPSTGPTPSDSSTDSTTEPTSDSPSGSDTSTLIPTDAPSGSDSTDSAGPTDSGIPSDSTTDPAC